MLFAVRKRIISKGGFTVRTGEDMQLAFAIEYYRGLGSPESIQLV